MADKDGRVASQGGDLAKYGIRDLCEGDCVAEKAYFLEGLLPTDSHRSVLCDVETPAGVFADIHLFPVEQCDCVLLLDASENVAERAQFEQSLREAEERLRQAEKMEALGRLAGGIAHDFNNLLTVILGYSEMLADALPTTEFGLAAHEIGKAAEKAAAMTQQLLSFSRRHVRHTEVLDLNSLISGVRQLLQRMIGEDIGLTATLSGELGYVEVDRGQMEQVLMNLAANARDAMPSGGRLEIQTENVTVDEAFLRKHPSLKLRHGPYVSLAVIDNGCGMGTEIRARAFEPFFTSKPAGQNTGLGLSIVYGIVSQAGGDIVITSVIGQGTHVKILLPAVQKAVTAEVIREDNATSQGTETILVVEDEEAVRGLIRTVLNNAGYNVLDCSDPFAAMGLCERYTRRIDLLVTDLILPGMDGATLAGLILKSRPETRVLYVSGYAPEYFAKRRVELPDDVFLPKPFTPAVLTNKVRQAFNRRTATSA
jgi:signal transduction histidine kinase/ActR/RegA family two-component response regulator